MAMETPPDLLVSLVLAYLGRVGVGMDGLADEISVGEVHWACQ